LTLMTDRNWVMDRNPPHGSRLRLDTVQAIVRPPAGGEHEFLLEPIAPGRSCGAHSSIRAPAPTSSR
jgi:hypothetical protein